MANQSRTPWCLFLLVVIAATTTPVAAKPRDLTEYTLRVHIFQSQWSPQGTFYGQGSGIANLYDGPNVRGITFSYECPIQYQQSVGNEAYRARWKKAEKTIELVGTKVGSPDKSDTCEFKITLHDFVYDVQNGTIATFTPEQYKIRLGAALPTRGNVDIDPAHYPLRMSVLQSSWESPLNGVRKGTAVGIF